MAAFEGFDKLFAMDLHHVIDEIFLSLDYNSYTTCLKVCKTWNDKLTSEGFKRKVRKRGGLLLLSSLPVNEAFPCKSYVKVITESGRKDFTGPVEDWPPIYSCLRMHEEQPTYTEVITGSGQRLFLQLEDLQSIYGLHSGIIVPN